MRSFVLAVVLGLLASTAVAQDWGKLATISTTMGVSRSRLCLGEASRGDIGCPAYAPSVTTAGDVSISGNVSANKFIGDGGGLTNIAGASADRIVSGTTSMLAISNTGYVSLTQSGVNTGWFDPSRGLVTIGVSSTGPISATNGYFSGKMGIGLATTPSATLHLLAPAGVSGTGLYLGRPSAPSNIGSLVFTDSGRFILNTPSNNTLELQYNNTTMAYVNATGLGVGNPASRPNPSATLQVFGTALTTSWTGINFSSGANVTPTAPLEVSGTVSATNFVGNGSGLTNVTASVSPETISIDNLSDASTTAPSTQTGSVYLGYKSGGSIVTGTDNVGVGIMALASATTGASNTGVGFAALTKNTTGYGNVGVGTQALRSTTTGIDNIGIGYQAGYGITAASNQIAIGNNAMMWGSASGGGNIAIGGLAMSVLGSAYNNNAIGGSALQMVTSGSYNNALGNFALQQIVGGHGNIGIGSSALGSLIVGNYQIAIGYNAMMNISGTSAVSYGANNVAIGYQALQGSTTATNDTASNNTVLGYKAGSGTGLTTASGNSIVGTYSGDAITTGNSNTLVGALSGRLITTGTNNITIGANADVQSGSGSNQLSIGNAIFGDLGRPFATFIGINVNSPTVALEVSGTISATRFVGDGSALTGVAAGSSDRIVSGSVSMVAEQTSGTVRVSGTLAMVNTGNEVCGPATWYSMRIDPSTGQMQMCRP